MKRKIILIIAAICLFGMVIFPVVDTLAKDVSFEMSLSGDKVAPGEQVRLTLFFFGRMDIPAPEMSSIAGVDIRYRGKSIKSVTAGGQTADSAVYTYSVISREEGEVRIGPVAFDHEGDKYISNTVVLEVTKEAAPSSRTSKRSRKGKGLSGRMYLEIDIPKKEVFINEKIPVTVNFYTDWLDVENLGVLDTREEEYVTGEYTTTGASFTTVDGIKFAVIEFSKSFFVTEPGEFRFGPVLAGGEITRRKADLMNDNEEYYNKFLGRRDSRSLEIESGPVEMKVRPLPAEGRPADFKGAIGSFKLDVKAFPEEVKEGGMITLTMKVSGWGNYNTVNAPLVEDTEELSIYGPRAARSEDRVVFTQSLGVLSSEVKAVPRISFSFFDPEKQKYVSIVKEPIPISVIPEGKAKKPSKEQPGPPEAAGKEAPAEELISLKAKPGRLGKWNPYFYRSESFVLIQIFPIFLLFVSIIVQKRRMKLLTDTAYAGWLRASKKAAVDIARAKALLRGHDARTFYDHVFKMMQEYLGTRFSIPPGGITGRIVERRIVYRVDKKDIHVKIRDIFQDCYLARFTSLEFDNADMKETFGKVREVISYFNSKIYL